MGLVSDFLVEEKAAQQRVIWIINVARQRYWARSAISNNRKVAWRKNWAKQDTSLFSIQNYIAKLRTILVLGEAIRLGKLSVLVDWASKHHSHSLEKCPDRNNPALSRTLGKNRRRICIRPSLWNQDVHWESLHKPYRGTRQEQVVRNILNSCRFRCTNSHKFIHSAQSFMYMYLWLVEA